MFFRAALGATLTLTPCFLLASELDSAFLSTPDIFGDRVVFTREGDLWVGDLVSGTADRLTRHNGVEDNARFSPDGSTIAFSGQYDGPTQVYTIDPMGGVPQRVTNTFWVGDMEGWYPDGESLLVKSYNGLFAPQLMRQPLSGGPAQQLPFEMYGTADLNTDGDQIAFTRFPEISGGAWLRYYGGAKNDIWSGSLEDREFQKVYESENPSQYPVWVGDRIYFLNEDNAQFSLMSVDADGRNARRETEPSALEMRELATDGDRLIYVHGPNLEVFDPETGNAETLRLELRSDRRHMQPYLVEAEDWLEGGSIGPTGKRLYMAARGQIISVPANEGEARVILAEPGVRYASPALSPEGDKLAFVSDATREEQVYVSDPDGSDPVQVTDEAGRQIDSVTWSPDGEWLAYTDSETRIRIVRPDGSDERMVSRSRRTLFALPFQFSPDSEWIVYLTQVPWALDITQINLYNLENDEHYLVSNGLWADDSPAFSSDGKYLVFTSTRDFSPGYDGWYSQLSSDPAERMFLLMLDPETPSPFLPESDEEVKNDDEEEESGDDEEGFVVEPEGLYERIVQVPVGTGNFGNLAMVGSTILFTEGGEVKAYDIGRESESTVAPGPGFQLSADNKFLALQAPTRVISVNARNQGRTSGEVDFGNLRLQVVPEKEWDQIYWDAWRLSRDYFYVRNLHGVDWDAIGEKYAQYLPLVRTRSELTELIRWLQSELSAGHSFRRDAPDRYETPDGTDMGYLGIETEPARSYQRITEMYDGDGSEDPSPLLAPGMDVEVGDYILRVAGTEVTEDVSIPNILRGRDGEIVSVVVNGLPVESNARTLYVEVIGERDQLMLKRMDWVQENRQKVAEMSDGRVGYIYLKAMGNGDYADFTRQWFPQLDKEAMIIDVRYNSGGYIGGVLVNILRKETYLRRNQRNALEPSTRYHDAFEGHLAAIINERSYSDGEGFPHRFQASGVGELIGMNTAGALVGSGPAWPLVDGGSIQVPRYGNYIEGEGWAIEGPGVFPDIRVENDPTSYAQGTDRQLEAAVQHLLEKLEREPLVRPVEPPGPTPASSRG
jgi:tricorn protease